MEAAIFVLLALTGCCHIPSDSGLGEHCNPGVISQTSSARGVLAWTCLSVPSLPPSGPPAWPSEALSAKADAIPAEGKAPSFLLFLDSGQLPVGLQRMTTKWWAGVFQKNIYHNSHNEELRVHLRWKNNLLPKRHYYRLCTPGLICHIFLGLGGGA